MISNKLLYSIIRENDFTTLYEVPTKVVSPNLQPAFDFLKTYYQQFKAFPDVDTVEQKFGVQLDPNTDKVAFWVDEAYEKYKQVVSENAIKDAARNPKDAEKIFQDALLELSGRDSSSVVSYKDGSTRKSRYEENKLNGGISYLSTGNDDFNSISAGIKKADLWTIGGGEGIGKTWLLLRMAIWIDKEMNRVSMTRPLLFVSCEMTSSECEDRLDCISAKIPYNGFLTGTLSVKHESIYTKYLARGVRDSNLLFVDDCSSIADVQAYINIYNPAAVFIDGSHLLAADYDWKTVAKLTSTMKRITRIQKIPIINTTHVKAGEGKEATGGDVDSFAYSKGYSRDSDIAGVMYASELMQIEGKVGVDWVKIRRGVRTRMVFQQDFVAMSFDLVEKNIVGGGGVKQFISGANNNGGSSPIY